MNLIDDSKLFIVELLLSFERGLRRGARIRTLVQQAKDQVCTGVAAIDRDLEPERQAQRERLARLFV